jgi:hypothetical protein
VRSWSKFKAGDFGKPALTHAQQVPGTADMARLKERITYQYEETPGGGRVRIVTRDTGALAAVSVTAPPLAATPTSLASNCESLRVAAPRYLGVPSRRY